MDLAIGAFASPRHLLTHCLLDHGFDSDQYRTVSKSRSPLRDQQSRGLLDGERRTSWVYHRVNQAVPQHLSEVLGPNGSTRQHDDHCSFLSRRHCGYTGG